MSRRQQPLSWRPKNASQSMEKESSPPKPPPKSNNRNSDDQKRSRKKSHSSPQREPNSNKRRSNDQDRSHQPMNPRRDKHRTQSHDRDDVPSSNSQSEYVPRGNSPRKSKRKSGESQSSSKTHSDTSKIPKKRGRREKRNDRERQAPVEHGGSEERAPERAWNTDRPPDSGKSRRDRPFREQDAREKRNDRRREKDRHRDQEEYPEAPSSKRRARDEHDRERDRERPKKRGNRENPSPDRKKRRVREDRRNRRPRENEYVAYGQSNFTREPRQRNSSFPDGNWNYDNKFGRDRYDRGYRRPRQQQYAEDPVPLPSADDIDPPAPRETPHRDHSNEQSRDEARARGHQSRRSKDKRARDSGELQVPRESTPTLDEHREPQAEATEVARRDPVYTSALVLPTTTGTPHDAVEQPMNGFHDAEGSMNGHATGDDIVSPQVDISTEEKEESKAIFSLDDLDKLIQAVDIVLEGLQKMHQIEILRHLKVWRDQLSNSLNMKVIPQSIDSFQEVSSMARSNDAGDFAGDDGRSGPTKPPIKKFRRSLPAVSVPRPLVGAGDSKRKPPKVSSNTDYQRRFELFARFGVQGWGGYDAYQLTSQETSDVSISPDVQYSQRQTEGKRNERKAVQQTPSSTSTGINTDISKLNAQKSQTTNQQSPSHGFDGFRQQPVFHTPYPNMMSSHGSFSDLRVAHNPYMQQNHFGSSGPLSGAQTSMTTTTQSTPGSSVPTFSGPPGLTPIVFNTDSRMPTVPQPMFMQYSNGTPSGPMSIPMVGMDAYQSPHTSLLRTSSASSVPNQNLPSRRGDGSFDPNRQPLLNLRIQVDKNEVKEIYFYPGDNVTEVARKFCVTHNILNHSQLVEQELLKILQTNNQGG